MKQVTIENVKERIADLSSNAVRCDAYRLSIKEEFELACLRKLVDFMQTAPVSGFEEAVELFKTMNIGFPVERTKADYVICWCLANVCQQTAPEHKAAVATLEFKGYTYHGGQMWKPPLGKPPAYITDEPATDNAAQQGDL